ncbi:MAG: type II toxin-antitoxin system RelE/ParE family toxin [Planctomycetota bacterium]
MTRHILIRPEAESELADAYRWYEVQRSGLGLELLLSIEATIEGIRENPESFPVIHEGIRRALARRFPYGVFYLVEQEAIVVLAIFHARRDPKHWQSRS